MNLIIIFISIVFTYLPTDGCPTKCKCWNYPIQRTLCKEGIDGFIGTIPKFTIILSINGSIRSIAPLHILKRHDLPILPALKILHMTHSEIGQIEDFVFEKYTILEELKLSFNRIQGLTIDTFHGLQKLKRLDLTGNSNLKIELNSFSGLVNLEQLYLGEIGATHISSEYFNCLNNIAILDLHGNNLLEFEYNFFGRINNLEFLDISGNNFRYLPKESFGTLANITTLNLRDNPWHCNCEMLRIRDELRKHVYDPQNIAGAIYCATPLTLAHLPLLDIESKDLICLQPSSIDCDRYNISANEGEFITLKCTMMGGDPKPYLNVKHPNGKLYNYRNDSHTKYRAFRNGSFYIHGASGQDSGQWVFSATNDHGKDVQKYVSLNIRKTQSSISSLTTRKKLNTQLHVVTSNNPKSNQESRNVFYTKSKDVSRSHGIKQERLAHVPTSFPKEAARDYGIIIGVAVGSSVITTLVCITIVFFCKKLKQRNKVSQFHNY